MKQFLSLVVMAIFITGCKTTTETTVQADLLLNDHAFPDYAIYHIETEDEIFKLDDDAVRFVRDAVGSINDPVDRMETLVRKIFDRSEFNLLYMGNANTTATQTFHNRAANCLSMSIMTYSLAKTAGFSVRFQDIKIPEYWTRREGYSLLNGHINLRIESRDPGVIHLLNEGYEVDFDPQNVRNNFPKKMVNKRTVMAMFYNNKGADALLSNSYTKAYAYFRAAAHLAPNFDSTWVNLGILYRIQEHYGSAEMAYNQALAIDEENLTAWENMAYLYEFTGRHEEARLIASKVERKRDDNPFYHFILGEQEFDNGNMQLALRHYRDALKLDKSKHEIYYGLAKTYYEMGDITRSQRYFKKARDRSRNGQDQERYQGKLDLLSRRNDSST
ncbi:tetratricopeptide repeat protein [Aliiglaciecola sp. M165]|uniref:tetratricopeptide repeat protein n=1 Tax=Aliiglaciecola sp. M165 TaxID=2593649 RepID=UPI001180DC9D|nr:tetratricopeptide repeat protein [Aliiglaciecola sp. M165]TRY32031.1 tetratricopeptide repeat protein [Aliiglaciecola sp. M165]